MSSDDDRIREIESQPVEFVKEALHWWNTTADKLLKRFVIVAAYQETIAVSMEELDRDISSM
jgi:hypothetical protein